MLYLQPQQFIFINLTLYYVYWSLKKKKLGFWEKKWKKKKKGKIYKAKKAEFDIHKAENSGL